MGLVTAGILAPTLALAATTASALTLSCSFERECYGANACGPENAMKAVFTQTDGGWDLQIMHRPHRVQPIEKADSSILHFIASQAENGDGMALISIFNDMSAAMTWHGDILAPTATTDRGTCTKEDG